MSPKYENRIKEFFATFFEFLQTHIRKKYYDFMNDIQAEVNFFEWFDKNYKPQILNNITTKIFLQKENKATHREPRFLITNHRPIITNTRSMITNHINQQMVADNIHFVKKQTLLTNQYGQINIINKNNTNVTYKD